jgi:hypothetical protein
MIVSPRVWFRLPGWIRMTGSLTEKKYGSGPGAFQIRLLGACLWVIVLWCFYDFLGRH